MLKKVDYKEILFKRDPNESLYLDLKKVKAKNRFLNMIVSGREMGKTLGVKKDIILYEAYFNHRKTAFFRRFATQIKREIEVQNWLGTALDLFKTEYGITETLEGETKGNAVYLNGELIAYLFSLTEAVNLKGPERLGFSQIVFDEFIERDNWHYIAPASEEPTNYLLKCISTLLRDPDIPQRETRVYLLSNSERLANPYFNEFDIVNRIGLETEWLMSKDVCLWLPRMSLALEKQKMESPKYRIFSNSSYADIAIKNSFFDNNDTNIVSKLLPGSQLQFGLTLSGMQLYVYKQENYFYFTNKGSEASRMFVMDIKYIEKSNQEVINLESTMNIREVLSLNLCRFSDRKIRTLVYDTFRGLNR